VELPLVLFPRNECAPAFDKANESAGVVAGLATEVVNIGESVPAENVVTVPVPLGRPVTVAPVKSAVAPAFTSRDAPDCTFNAPPLGITLFPGIV
jgi:hypothetical protein